jgi:predicted ArsR family transcriptional regulator
VPGTVEIIAEHLDDMAHTAFRTQIKEEDILALIERRPCTAAGTAAGLNIHITEAIKHLEMLVADGKAVTQPKDGQVFYSACELRTE